MPYERDRGFPKGDYYNREDPQDYGRDYGSGRDYTYSSARDYQAAGAYGENRRGYGGRDHGNQRYDQREQMNRDRDQYGQGQYGRSGYGEQRSDEGRRSYGQRDEYRGSYASDGRRWENVGRDRDRDDDDRQRDRGGYGRQPQGYDYEDRGFLARAGDEVRSWFGDDDAERRREADSRYDERAYADRDSDYHSWRRGQIDALDRDYHEYRQENRSKFENEFSSWRTQRQGQRNSLSLVKEHMEVLGSDGSHVGTVDKLRGDRIILTKNDKDAGGHHHSIPSRWIDKVEDKVTLSKTADEAKKAWRDEEDNKAMFGDRDRDAGKDREMARDGEGEHKLNRSFSGTY